MTKVLVTVKRMVDYNVKVRGELLLPRCTLQPVFRVPFGIWTCLNSLRHFEKNKQRRHHSHRTHLISEVVAIELLNFWEAPPKYSAVAE